MHATLHARCRHSDMLEIEGLAFGNTEEDVIFPRGEFRLRMQHFLCALPAGIIRQLKVRHTRLAPCSRCGGLFAVWDWTARGWKAADVNATYHTQKNKTQADMLPIHKRLILAPSARTQAARLAVYCANRRTLLEDSHSPSTTFSSSLPPTCLRSTRHLHHISATSALHISSTHRLYAPRGNLQSG